MTFEEEQEQKADVKKIENPCYHCYPGAIGECRLVSNCRYYEEHGQFPGEPDLENRFIGE